MDTAVQYMQNFLVLVAVITALGVPVRAASNRVIKRVKEDREANERRLRLEQDKLEMRLVNVLDEKLAPLTEQLFPNSGSSLRDGVDAAVDKLDAAQHERNQMKTQLNHLTGVAETTYGRVATMLENHTGAWYEMDYQEDPHGGPGSTNMVDVNDAYLHLFQVTRSEALAAVVWRNLIPPKDLDQIDAIGYQALLKKADFECAFRVLHKDKLVPVLARAKGFSVAGQFMGWTGVITPNWRLASPYDGEEWPTPPIQPWFSHERIGNG